MEFQSFFLNNTIDKLSYIYIIIINYYNLYDNNNNNNPNTYGRLIERVSGLF